MAKNFRKPATATNKAKSVHGHGLAHDDGFAEADEAGGGFATAAEENEPGFDDEEEEADPHGDDQAYVEASAVMVDDTWLPPDVLWNEADMDPTWHGRRVEGHENVWNVQRARGMNELYDFHEPFID